jgi:hypothetical protein
MAQGVGPEFKPQYHRKKKKVSLILSLTIVLTFPGSHVVGIMEYIAFSNITSVTEQYAFKFTA